MSEKIQSAREVRIVNRKARHRYSIDRTFEAGIVLQGTEVKSFRDGQAQIAEAFIRLNSRDEPMLYNAHIPTYRYGTDANHEPLRPRKLLLHRREVAILKQGSQKAGLTIVPLEMYLRRGLIKLSIGLCRGKNLRDKRQDLKRAVEMREAERAIANRQLARKISPELR